MNPSYRCDGLRAGGMVKRGLRRLERWSGMKVLGCLYGRWAVRDWSVSTFGVSIVGTPLTCEVSTMYMECQLVWSGSD